MAEINFFAKTNFRNQERVFGIKEDDRRRHMYVIGKTGMGKTNLLENMVVQDIQNGKGVAYIDPHGDTAEKILRAVPASRINDVIYFNPADGEFPLAFNILEAVDEDKKNLVASGMMGVFKKIWPDVWSPRMEYILNNTILALLDYPGSTMLGVNRMMSDKEYRKRVYPKIKDPVVKSFWLNEFEKWEDRFRKEAVAAIQNKVGQFLSSTIIRHIVGQPKSTFDIRKVMDGEKILIVNLSKGHIGEDVMRLLGGMVVTKMQLAAMGRVDTPEEKRKDFFLYVDEFQNFATESFANILSEARKYRLCLILAHQYINQLVFDGHTSVRDAIFGNVGTLVTFRVGAEDAEFLEKEFEPVFTASDLVNLNKYHIYLKLMIDGVTGDAFSAVTLPPVDLSDTSGNAEKVIRVSRERYGKSRAEVEEKISRWSGVMMEHIVTEELAKKEKIDERRVIPRKREKIPEPKSFPLPEKRDIPAKEVPKKELVREISSEPKKQYDSVCSSCEEKITVPFKPDPTRPTFCRECLKEYQRARALAQKEMDQKKYEKEERVEKNKLTNTPQETRRESVGAYVSKDKPISLSQVPHIAPKKFKPERKKTNINLGEVRDLLNQIKTKNNG